MVLGHFLNFYYISFKFKDPLVVYLGGYLSDYLATYMVVNSLVVVAMAGVDGRGGGVETSSMSVEDSGGGGAQDGQADQGLDHKGGYMYYFSVEWITGHFGYHRAIISCSLTLKNAIVWFSGFLRFLLQTRVCAVR